MDIYVLLTTVISIAFMHTLLGPDHYLPFIVMSKARKWRFSKTLWITGICGLGHVGSSVILGILGVSSGFIIAKIDIINGYRGNIAAWAFMIFGLIYFFWGLYRVIKKKSHAHIHFHKNGTKHVHTHSHGKEHNHIHKKNITPWVLFTIFVLGPCEPLIPLVMYPAIQNNVYEIFLVVSVFAIITIVTMITVVGFAYYGINFLPFGKFEKYSHALAGGVIFLSGFAIEFMGL